MTASANKPENDQSFGVGIFSMQHIVAELRPQSAIPQGAVPPKKRGRPKIRDESYYLSILEMLDSMSRWFLVTFGRKHRSVNELCKVYYIDLFQKHNLRVMSVDSPEFRGRIRTLENEISRAKKIFKHAHK